MVERSTTVVHWSGRAGAARGSPATPRARHVSAPHMDLYDGPGVGLAMNKLAPFFKGNL
jgi:hypothetical protein